MGGKRGVRRGRRPGKYKSHRDTQLIRYLARISAEYGIDSNKFFGCLLRASDNEKAECGQLTIECRRKTQGHTTFLIKNDIEIVAQLHVPEYILAKVNPLREFTYRSTSAKKLNGGDEPKNYQIKDLMVGMRHVNVRARVLEVSEPRIVATRHGRYAYLANIIVADETGNIQMPLWNERVKEFSAGDHVQVENADVVTFRGLLQLKIGRNGKLTTIKNR